MSYNEPLYRNIFKRKRYDTSIDRYCIYLKIYPTPKVKTIPKKSNSFSNLLNYPAFSFESS